jgi:hypothetical protein
MEVSELISLYKERGANPTTRSGKNCLSRYGLRTALTPTHHEKFRFTWRMVLADGKVFLEGIDFGELNSDGKLHRIVGFFGPLAQAID